MCTKGWCTINFVPDQLTARLVLITHITCISRDSTATVYLAMLQLAIPWMSRTALNIM